MKNQKGICCYLYKHHTRNNMKNFIAKLNNKINEMSKLQELIWVCILSAGLVFGVLLLMGTMTCGWHLTDDHEFLRIMYYSKVEGRSFWDILVEFISRDLSIRFRPIYMPARVLSCYIFGENLFLYYVMKALETFVSCVLLYYIGQQFANNKIASFLFAAISLVGYQSAAWWKLGTHEMQGVLLLSISWLSLMWWIKKGKKVWEVVSIVSAVLMMLYKESFLALVPFIMVFTVYYDLLISKSEFTLANLREIIKKRWDYLIIVGLILACLACCFVFGTGVSNYDMSGDSSGGMLSAYWSGIVGSLEGNLKWHFRFGILFVAILLTYWDDLKKQWKEILIVSIFAAPQLVIYGNVGFSGHYLLPLTIAFSLFFILVTLNWKSLSGKRRIVYFLGILLLLGANGRVALREADYFRMRGEGITTAFETIRELSEENKDIKVLSCFGCNTEANYTLQYWLLNRGIDNLYYWNEDENLIDVSFDGSFIVKENTEIYGIDDMDIVIMHNKEDRHWYYEPIMDLSDFTEIPCGTLTLFVRNDKNLEIPDIEIEGLRINF